MVDSVNGYLFTAQQMSRDLITLSGGGTTISIKGVVRKQNQKIVFSSSTLLNYNVFVHSGKVYRVDDISILKEGQYEVSANLDILSTIYYNSGSVTIQSQRNHLPSRCINREWGGEELETSQIVGNYVGVGDTIVVFVCFTATHNTLLNREGDLIRYIMPVTIYKSLGGPGGNVTWADIMQVYSTGYYSSLNQCVSNIDSITGLDGASIIDVSYSLIPPYSYSYANKTFMNGNTIVPPNCTHTFDSKTIFFYQLDFINEDEVSSCVMGHNFIEVSIPKNTIFSSYIPQDMTVFVDGRKVMDLLPKNDEVDLIVTPFYSSSGVGMIISQGSNATTVMGSKLPWISDYWNTYLIQKKGTDEAKMWYDSVKGVASTAIGIGGAGVSGGATAMSVPSSVASLGDAYANQKFTEEYTKKVPYGAGAPYGDVGLFYLLPDLLAPIYVTITTYTGQPSDPVTKGKTIGYPCRGVDTITTDGYYQGDIISISSSLNLNQNEINILSNQLSRGVRT